MTPAESSSKLQTLLRLRAQPVAVAFVAEPPEGVGRLARAAGIEGAEPVRERPTCAVIPQVMASGRGQASFACIGNRVYTGLGDEEIYFAVPGGKLDVFVEALVAVAAANDKLEAFHRSRLPQA